MRKKNSEAMGGALSSIRHAARGQLVLLAILALASAALAACGSSNASSSGASKTIVIGGDFGLTGSFSLLGQPDANGAKALVDSLNQHGGTNGVHYKLIIENNQSSPSQAATVAKTLITQDHASVILGPEETSEVAPVAEVAAAYKVIDLTPSAFQNWPPSHPSFTPAELKYVFPELVDFNASSTQAYDTAVWKPKGYTKIAVLVDSTPFGLDELPVVNALAKKDGFTIVGEQTFAAGATDVTPQVQKLLNDHPQFLFSWTTPGPDTIVAVKSVRELDPALPVGIAGGQDTPATVSTLGAADANKLYALASISQPNVIQALPSSDPQKKVAQQFTTVVNQYHVNTEGGANTVYQGWDLVYLLEHAIESAGSTAPSALLKALDHQKLAALSDVWARTQTNPGAFTTAPGYVVQYNGSSWQYIGSYGT